MSRVWPDPVVEENNLAAQIDAMDLVTKHRLVTLIGAGGIVRSRSIAAISLPPTAVAGSSGTSP